MPSRSDSTVESSASTIQNFDSPGAPPDSLILREVVAQERKVSYLDARGAKGWELTMQPC